MQIFPCPRFSAKPPHRLSAQLPQSCPGTTGAILVCGKIGEVFADQGVDGRIPFGGVPADRGEYAVVHA